MASLGRNFQLIYNGEPLAGCRAVGKSFEHATVEISAGESSQARKFSDIIETSALDLNVEGVTKDFILQNIAALGDNQRLENLELRFAPQQGENEAPTITGDFILSGFSVDDSYQEATVFSCSLLNDMQILGGQVVDGVGYTTSNVYYCYSNALDNNYWVTVGDVEWQAAENRWRMYDAFTSLIKPLNGWEGGYRPEYVYITAYTDSPQTFIFGVLDIDFNTIGTDNLTLSTTPQTFRIPITYQGFDILEIGVNANSVNVYVGCIQFSGSDPQLITPVPNYFDTSFWMATASSEWQAGSQRWRFFGASADIHVSGTAWEAGYRPERVYISISAASSGTYNINIRDTSLSIIASEFLELTTTPRVFAIQIDFGANDIQRIRVDASAADVFIDALQFDPPI